jgi:peptidoglycan hydrolase-like protein with peptidoglycan-binding domain
MNKKTIFGLGAFVIVALLVAGIAYWVFGENWQPTAPPDSAGAPPAAPQVSTPPAPPPSPSTPPATVQSNQPTASPAPSPATPSAAEQGQATAPPPATPAAPTATLPAENQMSDADRREVQEVLQRLSYYQGPIDGKFGPLTRAAIRRFQDNIGVKSTGYLTAAEATRLASSH